MLTNKFTYIGVVTEIVSFKTRNGEMKSAKVRDYCFPESQPVEIRLGKTVKAETLNSLSNGDLIIAEGFISSYTSDKGYANTTLTASIVQKIVATQVAQASDSNNYNQPATAPKDMAITEDDLPF